VFSGGGRVCTVRVEISSGKALIGVGVLVRVASWAYCNHYTLGVNSYKLKVFQLGGS